MMAIGLDAAAAWLADFAASVAAHEAELTELDRAIGDADHGANMARGMAAVTELDASGFADAAAYLKKAGMVLVSTVGGAAGPLYGTFLLRLAGALEGGVGPALRAALGAVVARGKAHVGDSTLVDALAPAVEAFESAVASGAAESAAWRAAAAAAASGRDATIPLVARKGRASYLGERSAGHQDPGATSMALLFESAARTLG